VQLYFLNKPYIVFLGLPSKQWQHDSCTNISLSYASLTEAKVAHPIATIPAVIMVMEAMAGKYLAAQALLKAETVGTITPSRAAATAVTVAKVGKWLMVILRTEEMEVMAMQVMAFAALMAAKEVLQ
jgi:hypothetical protein